jgi:YD repeat-containing protein
LLASVYDRRGRRTSVTNGAEVATFTYNYAGQLLTETFPNSRVIVTNTYDGLLRRSSLSGTGILPVQFSYDAASRLSSVAQASLLAVYSYLPNSSLISNMVFSTSGVTKMTTTKTWDNLNRLQ